MAERGYEVRHQSGEFAHWFRPVWDRKSVVVTFGRVEGWGEAP
jgi:hypothetical protein